MAKIENRLLELMRQKAVTTNIIDALDPVKANLREFMDKLPDLPPGWKYEYDQEIVYNEEMKCYDCKLTATPRQVYKIEED